MRCAYCPHYTKQLNPHAPRGPEEFDRLEQRLRAEVEQEHRAEANEPVEAPKPEPEHLVKREQKPLDEKENANQVTMLRTLF